MKDRIVSLGLIFIIAIFTGIFVSAHYTTVPLIKELISQQGQILALQRSIDNNVKSIGSGAGKDTQLLTKLVSLEQKVDKMAKVFENFKQPSQRPQRPQEDYSKVYTIDVGHTPVRGKKDAPITIAEFVDFQCPFSSRFHPALNQLIKEYPDKVNYMIKNFPLGFHKQAKPAARAAFAAGEQGKYYEMADLILQNNRDLNDEKYEELAKQLGLNVKKFLKDYKENEKYDEWIAADMALGTKVNVRGTPTFYINGKKTRARTLQAYKDEVDALLKEKE